MMQVTGDTKTPPGRTISVRLSDKIGELELVDLPMLPSLERNSAVSQCYERVETSDPAETPEDSETQASVPAGDSTVPGLAFMSNPC